MFLDSRDKFLNMLKFCRNDQRKEQKKKKWSVLVAESAYNAQNAQFGLVMIKLREMTSVISANKISIRKFYYLCAKYQINEFQKNKMCINIPTNHKIVEDTLYLGCFYTPTSVQKTRMKTRIDHIETLFDVNRDARKYPNNFVQPFKLKRKFWFLEYFALNSMAQLTKKNTK